MKKNIRKVIRRKDDNKKKTKWYVYSQSIVYTQKKNIFYNNQY